MKKPTCPPDKVDSCEPVAQRFASFLAIGAARLLAKDPMILGHFDQGQSAVGEGSSRRSTPPTIRECVGDASAVTDDLPGVGVDCGELVAEPAETFEPSLGRGRPEEPITEEDGGNQP